MYVVYISNISLRLRWSNPIMRRLEYDLRFIPISIGWDDDGHDGESGGAKSWTERTRGSSALGARGQSLISEV
jgi:hypothetical protein